MIPGAVIAQPLPRPTVRFALGRAGTAPRSSRGRIGGPLRRHGSGTVPFLAVSGPGQGGCDPEALQDALRTWGLGQERPGRANRSKQKNVPSPRPPSPTSRSKEAGGRNSLIPRAFANATEPISPIAVMHGSPWQATGPQRRLIWFLGVSNALGGSVNAHFAWDCARCCGGGARTTPKGSASLRSREGPRPRLRRRPRQRVAFPSLCSIRHRAAAA